MLLLDRQTVRLLIVRMDCILTFTAVYTSNYYSPFVVHGDPKLHRHLLDEERVDQVDIRQLRDVSAVTFDPSESRRNIQQIGAGKDIRV